MIHGMIKFCLYLLLMKITEASFGYDDLKNINGSCYAFGSCEIGKGTRLDLSLDWKDVNCFCDDRCLEFGDCCLGAKDIDLSQMKDAYKNYECINTEPYGSYYMKGTCSKDWTSSGISDLCHKASPESSTFHNDPFLDIPVTSLSSDTTYKNYYCAICNKESSEDLEVWHAQLTCPEVVPGGEEFIRENLLFVNGSWGLYVNDSRNGVSSFLICDILPMAKETIFHKIRRCKNFIGDCSPKWEDAEVEGLCQSYTTLVYGPAPEVLHNTVAFNSPFDIFQFQSSNAYRNYHCAVCNFINVTDLTCYERNFRQAPSFTPVSFSTLFDFGVKKSVCDKGQIWDPFTKMCRQVVCSEKNSEFRGGRCVKTFDNLINTTPSIADEDENTTYDASKESVKMKCDKLFLNESDFTRTENGTIKVTIFRRTYKEEEYEVYKEGILVCIPDSYSRLMGWLTLVGLGLSCACLIAHLITFLIVPDLRNLSGKNLASMCVALLVAYICFLITSFKESGTDSCPVLASVMYYCFLASFFWMNVMAFDIWRTLQMATSELRLTAGKQWKKFAAYSSYAWLAPLLVLIFVLSIDHSQPYWISPSYLPELGKRLCWFGQRKAILVYFAAPLAFIMLLNIVFFLLAVKMVAPSARSSTVSCTQSNQVQLKLYLRLALLMGLSWVSGIIAGYIQIEYVWYIFILLNAFQGLFILLAFTWTKKVAKALKNKNSLKNSYTKSYAKNSLRRQVLESQDSNHSHLSNTSSTNLSTVTTLTSKSSLAAQTP